MGMLGVEFIGGYIACWWRWRPPLVMILLKNFITQPFLPPYDRLRKADL
jgi:hypothetical protein